MLIGEDDPAAQPVFLRDSVRDLWDEARLTLESLGATVEEVYFPLVTNHEVPPVSNEVGSESNGSSSSAGMDAYALDDFLGLVEDPSNGITTVNPPTCTLGAEPGGPPQAGSRRLDGQ